MVKSKPILLLSRLIAFTITFFVWYYTLPWLPNSIQLLFLFTFGGWCWAANLDVLFHTGIDPLPMLNHVAGFKVSGIYGIVGVFSASCCIASWAFGIFQNHLIPVILYFIVIMFMMQPWNMFYRLERFTFIKSCFRSVFSDNVILSDVILCDILTSFSRVVSQLPVELAWIAVPDWKETYQHNRGSLSSAMDIIIPVLVSIPYLLRLRQCILEASSTKDVITKNVHLYNALKYISSIPVIITGHFVGEWVIASKQDNYNESDWNWRYMVWCWIIALLFNSSFSLYWDLVMDWQLFGSLSLTNVSKPLHFQILRNRLHFKYPIIYYIAIILNIILRYIWLTKVFFLLEQTRLLDVTLTICEIFRRWVWVFFRLERDWVNMTVSTPLWQVEEEMEDQIPINNNKLES
ncbi:EXS family-domain-containing protein [Globomyces pollinis-pini]|nr:EXS family-domain-containing protein [Globomyces pollinis-pini]